MARRTVSSSNSELTSDFALALAPGWHARRRVAPSALSGANGIRFGPDGLLYVAQFLSSRIGVIDPNQGTLRQFDGDAAFVAPDDIDFDDDGVMYVTEVMDGRVSARMPQGDIRLVAAGLPGANGIACHQGRVFVDEFRTGGRILELYPDKSPRVIAENVPLPNAMCVGPDGYLYYPAVAAGQIWRVHPDRGATELFCDGLAMPTAAKFAPDGDLVITEAALGKITRVDIVTRVAASSAQLRPGLDNCAFDANGHLFVSHFLDGGISELRGDGSVREVVTPGLLGPWDLDVDAAGVLYIADGMRLLAVDTHGHQRTLASYTSHGFPGFLRNVLVLQDDSFVVSTSAGVIALYTVGEEPRVLASGLEQIAGLALGREGQVLAAEAGTGRILEVRANRVSVFAAGLGRPMGVVGDSGTGLIVCDAGGGRILHVSHDGFRTVADGLRQPQGLVCFHGDYVVVDRGTRSLLRVTASGTVSTIASGLPTGESSGLPDRVLPGSETLPGPLIAYSGLAVGGDASLFVACDADGSVLELRASK